MHIGYLVSQYPAINHTFILREIRTLRAAGYSIPVVSMRVPDRPTEALSEEEREELQHTTALAGLPRLRLAALILRPLLRHPLAWMATLWSAVRGGNLRHALYFLQAAAAGQLFTDAGVRHFHVHFSSTVGLLATKLFPLTMSNTFHGPDEFTDPAGFRMAEKVRASRFVVAISAFGRSQILRSCPWEEWSKVHVARLGIDPAVFTPSAGREGNGSIELLSVGRLAPVKGQHILIDAVAELRRRGCDVRLRLAGDGPDRASLERHAAAAPELAGAVVFEGWCNQEKVRQLYASADVYAMASFAEGIPVVLMEAMATETPAVATWVAGIPELIEHGRTGLLAAAGDATMLADAIEPLVRDPGRRRELGKAGRQRVLADYDLARNTQRLAELFSAYVEAPRSRYSA